jgi:Glycosyl hydrolase family 12
MPRRHTLTRHTLTRQMLARAAAPLLVLGVVAGVVTPASASPSRPGSISSTICQRRGHQAVTARGQHYVVKNDNYGGQAECMTLARHRVGFTVTRSAASSYGPEAMAYPFALYGCSWGTCTRGSGLPAPVSHVRRATASWSFTARARGRWSAAVDVWFGRHRSAWRDQARGAELMIWLNAGDFPAHGAAPIWIGHRRWLVRHWVARIGSAHWNYVQVRAFRPVSRVRGLKLMPIIRRVERMGLVQPHWWMLNIESGFEIWHGGRGLATRSFTASVRRRS